MCDMTRNMQACRGYKISHPYPHPYPQIFPWISMGISMDISMDGYIHGLTIACKIATTIPQSTTVGRASYQNDHDAGILF